MPTTSGMTNPNLPVYERFKGLYEKISVPERDELAQIYASDVTFRDPVHEIHGIEALHTYMASTCAGIESGRFEYLDEVFSHDTAYVKWDMHFVHPRLGDQTICVRGMTQIQFTGLVSYHEDVYDMGELLYDHLPVLSTFTTWLKRRLRKAAG